MRMKISKIFMIIIALTLILSPNLYAINVIDDKDERIKSILIGYLSNSLEEQKILKVITNNYIVPNSSLSEYDKLQSKLLVNWCKEIGVKIKSYNVDIRINSIEKTGEAIRIDLDNIVQFQYEKANFNSGYIDNHVIYLSEYGDSLLVEKDIFEMDTQAKNIENDLLSFEGSDGYEKYISNKINILESREETFDEDVNEFKNQTNKKLPNNSITPLSVTYNASAAANWALNHVYDAEDYPDADCTNFVSKALRAGGLPTDGTWYQGSEAWIRVIELRDWLINKGYATEYYSYSYAQLGDVIQYEKASNGVFTHSVIVTARDSWSEYPYVSAHSSPRRNVLASIYYPNNSSWSGYRVLDVHGN